MKAISLKKNIIASYLGQIYLILISISILPLYIKYMGAEAYGLVGFFTLLQSLFTLLDIGLVATISRETASYFGGATPRLQYLQLIRALKVIFYFTATIGAILLLILSDYIAFKWLDFNKLAAEEVVLAVRIMAIAVALRWLGGLYRGIINGSENLVLLNNINIFIATLKFIGVFASMYVFGFTPKVFFLHQLAVVIMELCLLYIFSRPLIPKLDDSTSNIGWSIKPIKSVLNFALTVAFTSSIGVLISQTDKMVLSGILGLSDYGYFSMAVIVASGIMSISGPVSSALMPRMARLHAEKKETELIRVYRNSTQLITVVGGSAALTIAIFSNLLLFAWTGDAVIVGNTAPILSLYALGNTFFIIGAFAYYLQYALGNLKYHLIGNVLMAIMLIPTIIFAAKHYGGVGAGYTWMAINVIYLFVWVGFVHHKLRPGLHLQWLTKDFLFILIPTAILLLMITCIEINTENRLIAIGYLFLISTLALCCSAVMSSVIRSWLKSKLSKKVNHSAKD